MRARSHFLWPLLLAISLAALLASSACMPPPQPVEAPRPAQVQDGRPIVILVVIPRGEDDPIPRRALACDAEDPTPQLKGRRGLPGSGL